MSLTITTPPTLQEEQYVLIGVILSLVAYGAGFLIFIQCIVALRQPAKVRQTPQRTVFMVYTCVMFLFGTLYITINTSLKILAFTTHRNFPGGPVAWVDANYSSPVTFTSNLSTVVLVWGSDGLLLYRCSIIYRDSLSTVRLVLLLPIVLFIAEIVSGLLVIIQVSHTPTTIWNSIHLGLPYFAICAACNVTITLTIATPLLLHRRHLAKTFGTNNVYSRPYTSAAAILIESSALYAVVAVLFIAFYARNNPVSHIFLSTLSQVQVVAPFLIILRVATKRAWTSTTQIEIANATTSRATEIRFRGIADNHRDNDSLQYGEVHFKAATRHSFAGEPSGPGSKDGTDNTSISPC